MADRFETYPSVGSIEAPASRHYAITPANSNLAIRPRALIVTVAGDVAIQDELGTNITYAAVPAYTILPIRAVQVRTATTATVVGWD
jgi:hypothetical protein